MNSVNPQVKSIFGHALAIDAVEERVAYLEQACGNDEAPTRNRAWRTRVPHVNPKPSILFGFHPIPNADVVWLRGQVPRPHNAQYRRAMNGRPLS